MAIDHDHASGPPAGMPHDGIAGAENGHALGIENDAHHVVEYEEFIEGELRKTRSHVRSVDLTADLMTLSAGTLGYVLLVVLLDHWLLSGGLGFWGRLVLLLVYVGGVGYYLATQVLPLALRRINPVYAAHTIERSRPSLKNGLVNFLMLRDEPEQLSPVVFEALKEQAATRLAHAEAATAVDRSKLIRVGYLLAGLVLLCALYKLFSPKDPFPTIGRLVMPWAEIAAPTRTLIVEVEPGHASAFRGQQVTVRARVQGMPSEERVWLFITTADGQTVDQPLEMNLDSDGYKHIAILPDASNTLQQSLTYRIEAGDAVSPTYRVEVVAAPTMVVESVTYRYPAYTGLLEQRLDHRGDIKALEGTSVTIMALANQEIDAASVDFDCDHKHDLRMQADKERASATFRLALDADRLTPQYQNYQLLFKNRDGQQNPQPIRHQIEVLRDVSPEIQFLAPKRDEIDLAADDVVTLEVVANDPDFALRRVQLRVHGAEARVVLEQSLLDEPRRGQFVARYRFDPKKLGLKPGDVVDYLAAAEDNREPEANRSETARRRIRIVSPTGKATEDQLADRSGADGAKRPPRDGDPVTRDPDAGRDDSAADKVIDRRDDAKPDAREQVSREAAPDPGPDEAERPTVREDEQADQKAADPRKPRDAAEPKAKEPDDPAIASDGSNDSDAIEEILKHREEQAKDASSTNERQEQQRDQRSGEQASGQNQAGSDNSKSADNASQGKDRREPQQADKRDPRDKREPRDKSPDDAQESAGDQNEKSDDKQQQGQQRGEKSGQDQQKADSKKSDQQKQAGDKQGQKDPGNQQGQGQQPNDQGQGGQEKSDGKQDQGGQQEQSGQKGKQGQSGKRGDQKDKSGASGADGQQGDGQQGGQAGGQDQSGKQDGGASAGDKKSSAASKSDGKRAPQDAQTTDDAAAGDESEKGSEGAAQQNGKPPKGDGKDQPSSDDGADQAHSAKDDNSKNGQSADKQQGKSKSDTAKSGDKSGNRDQRPSDPSTQPETADGRDAEKSPDDQQADDANSAGNGNRSGQGGKAQPDKPRDGSRQPKPESRPETEPQPDDAQSSANERQQGEAGAGQSSKDSQGSPNPQDKNRPRDKSGRPSQDSSQDGKQEAQSPSTSEHESDSEGQSDGDRSGGGKKGGGQKANKPGTGGPGENTAADEGHGRANETGKGETGSRAGSDRAADGQTGQSGSEPGAGSSTTTSKGQGGQAGSSGADGSPRPGNASNESGSQQSGAQGTGNPGNGSGNSASEQPFEPNEEQQDAANLDYARKATDLALDHLKDELRKQEPDPALLKRLGWNRQQLDAFVKRWEQMRKQAQVPGESGANARRELDESLRSLGLRPRATSVKSNASRDDRVQGLKQSNRVAPPPDLADPYKAYLRGTARGGK